MSEEQAWNQAEKLTLLFGSLAIECIALFGICLLILGEFRERRKSKKND